MNDWPHAAADFEKAAALDPGAVPRFKAMWDQVRRRLAEGEEF